jgi:predicted enzyme related to lactoylglutathione lyase
MAANAVVHVDIPLTDQESGATFYKQTFGWNIDNSMPGYPMFQAEGGPGGGFPHKGTGEMDMPNLRVYLGVPNIEDALRKVEANGGKTVQPRINIEGGHGAFAVFEDPSGNVLALYEAPPQG